jgi:hypothetical protein
MDWNSLPGKEYPRIFPVEHGDVRWRCINKFQTWHRDLEDINDGAEGYSVDTKLQAFLDNIKHPKYTITVGCIKNISELDMDIAIDRIRHDVLVIDSGGGKQATVTARACLVLSETGLPPPIEIQGYGSTGPPRLCKIVNIVLKAHVPNEDRPVLFVLNRVLVCRGGSNSIYIAINCNTAIQYCIAFGFAIKLYIGLEISNKMLIGIHEQYQCHIIATWQY